MAQIDWDRIISPDSKPASRNKPNVKFFNAYNENAQKTLEAGRPIFDEIPSISIQWPGMDETVRRIEPGDAERYPAEYSRFQGNSEPITDGLPLSEWPPMTGSAMRELNYLGFKTVEQLASANDDIKRRLGTLSKFVKLANDWLSAAQSDQSEVVRLRQILEKEKANRLLLQERVELLLQRIEANEGTDLRGTRKEMSSSDEQFDSSDDDSLDETVSQKPRRGRPKKL